MLQDMGWLQVAQRLAVTAIDLPCKAGIASILQTAEELQNHSCGPKHDHNARLQAFLPVWFNRFTATTNPGNTFCLGGMSDSYYEYLLKVWLLKSKQACFPLLA